ESRLGLTTSNHSGCVDRLFLGFVISARQDLAHQPQAQELDTRQNQYRRPYHQRPILKHYLLMENELLEDQESTDEATGSASQQSEESEEMQRPGRVVEQEFDAQQVQEDPEDSRKSIVRLPVLARTVFDGDF